MENYGLLRRIICRIGRIGRANRKQKSWLFPLRARPGDESGWPCSIVTRMERWNRTGSSMWNRYMSPQAEMLLYAAAQRDPVIGRGVGAAREAPRGIEVVLGAGAVQRRRPLLAIDEDHVVAFPRPGIRLAGGVEIVDAQHAPDVMVHLPVSSPVSNGLKPIYLSIPIILPHTIFRLLPDRSMNSGPGCVTAALAKVVLPSRASDALMEAIERYSGIFQSDEIRVTRRFTDFPVGDAIFPNDVLLFSETQLAVNNPEEPPPWTLQRNEVEEVIVKP